ncbi:MAG: hypothetical protein RIS11_1814, partial [Pseudomonadota bacterium]
MGGFRGNGVLPIGFGLIIEPVRTR